MERYPYDNHVICNLTVQMASRFFCRFLLISYKIDFVHYPLVNMGEILVKGLIPCGGVGRLSSVGECRLSHGLMKILRNAHEQCIETRSIIYNDEKSKLSSIAGKVWITFLNSHFPIQKLCVKYGGGPEIGEVWI